MTNQQILNRRFRNIDKYLKEYLINYKKINQKLKDRLQGLFESINVSYSEINKLISKQQKQCLDRKLLELQEQGLFEGVFGYDARQILNRKNVSYSEMLSVLIKGIYIKQNDALDEYNQLLYTKVVEYSYNQALDEIRPQKRPKFRLPILYALLNIPILNATAEQYMYALALANAEEMYKQTLVNIQTHKLLNIDNVFYKQLIKKQQNRFLRVNVYQDGYKVSGGIETVVETLSTGAFLRAGLDTNAKECRFVAEIDERTTQMCKSLNNQIFSLTDFNKYDRYSAIDNRIIRYTTKGMVPGENLPPINNHFHWCRSTITYQL